MICCRPGAASALGKDAPHAGRYPDRAGRSSWHAPYGSAAPDRPHGRRCCQLCIRTAGGCGWRRWVPHLANQDPQSTRDMPAGSIPVQAPSSTAMTRLRPPGCPRSVRRPAGDGSQIQGGGARPLGGLEHQAGAASGHPGPGRSGARAGAGGPTLSYLRPRNPVNNAVCPGRRFEFSGAPRCPVSRRTLGESRHSLGQLSVRRGQVVMWRRSLPSAV
jgi:hypothetical protein